MLRALSASLLALSLLAGPAVARADHGAGAFRLGGGSTVFSIEYIPDPEISVILYGLPVTPYLNGVHAGYMVSDSIYLGLQFQFGGQTIDTSGPFGVSIDRVFFTLLPRFTYMIALSSSASLYFGAEAGYSVNGDPDANPDDVFKAGGIGGVSLFVEDSFSIDAEATISFTHHPDSANAGFQAGLHLTFSGWVGGGSTGHSDAGGSQDDGGLAPTPAPTPEPDPYYGDPEGGLE